MILLYLVLGYALAVVLVAAGRGLERWLRSVPCRCGGCPACSWGRFGAERWYSYGPGDLGPLGVLGVFGILAAFPYFGSLCDERRARRAAALESLGARRREGPA